jgi:hypothetical protein
MTDKPKKPDEPMKNLVFKPFLMYPLYKKDEAEVRHPNIFSRISIISATQSRHKPDTKK